jgi:3-deoxy-D-manno-octulosonic-acid transferase
MQFLYNLGIRLYTITIHLAALLNPKARQWVKGRKNIFKTIKASLTGKEKVAWFHASSLGEFEQGRPVIEAFRKKYPAYTIVLTFFSPSGYEIRKNYQGADFIFYLPADTPANAKRFCELVNPRVAFFIKYEFWYNYLSELHQRQIPVYIFSAIFRPQQLFFKSYGSWYRKVLTYFTRIFVQDVHSQALLTRIGIENVEVGGDTRFDRVYDLVSQAKELPLIEKFVDGSKVIVAGSTWHKDEDLLVAYMNEASRHTKLIIAPHEVHKANIDRLEQLCDGMAIKYSEAENADLAKAKILIIDSIGLLSSLYRYGQIGYIGGGFGKGIHNTLEAATYGVPVVFGPKYSKFLEARQLIDLGAASTFRLYEEMKDIFDMLFAYPEQRISAGKAAANFVNDTRGGTALLMAHLAEKLGE